jgi:putative sterol carrier protein
MKSGHCKVSQDAEGKPDLELITTTQVWSETASGKLSPLEAFGRGNVRIRGDIELARVLARRVRET